MFRSLNSILDRLSREGYQVPGFAVDENEITALGSKDGPQCRLLGACELAALRGETTGEGSNQGLREWFAILPKDFRRLCPPMGAAETSTIMARDGVAHYPAVIMGHVALCPNRPGGERRSFEAFISIPNSSSTINISPRIYGEEGFPQADP